MLGSPRALLPLARRIRSAIARSIPWGAWAAAAVLALRAPGGGDPHTAVRWFYLPALVLVAIGSLAARRSGVAAACRGPVAPGRGARQEDSRPHGREGQAARRNLARPDTTIGASAQRTRRIVMALAVAILALAVLLRLWRFGEWPPPGIGFEEYELAARANIPGGPLDRLVAMYARPIEHTLTAYAVSLSFALFGTGFVQMRLPFLLSGIASPFFFYAVARRLVASVPALFALALFAVSWWQVAGSRPADEIFFPLSVELAVLWCVLCFEDTASPLAAFGLALGSGLLIYEYSAYHLAAPLVAAYLLLRAARGGLRIARQPGTWPERWRWALAALRPYAPGALALALVWVILARLQLIRDVQLGMQSWVFEGIRRHGTTGMLGHVGQAGEAARFAAQRVGDALHAFYTRGYGGEDRFFGLGEYPAFDPITAAAMGLGTVLVVVTPRRRWHLFVLAWTLIIILGAALLPGNLNTHRYYVALPFLYLIVALGAGVLWDWLSAPAARAALAGVLAAAALVAAAANVHRLYWELLPDAHLRSHWIWPRTEIARWLRARPPTAPACVVATDEDPGITGRNPLRPEWAWLLNGWNVSVTPTIDGCLPAASGTAPRYVVYTLPSSAENVAAILRHSYPELTELAPITIPGGQVVGRTFTTVAAESNHPER